MVDAVRVFDPGFQVMNAAGVPQAGAVLRFYTTTTGGANRTVYSDLGLSTSLGFTITCNAAGRPAASAGAGAEVLIYTGTTAYAVSAETSAGVALWSFNNVIGALDTSTFLTGSVIAETPVISKATTYTILTTDQGKVINADPTGSTFTLTLPSAVTATDGWRIHIRHIGTANSVIVATVSAQTINGTLTTWTLDGQFQSIQLVSDGANWHIDGDAMGGLSVLPFHISAAAVPYQTGILNGTVAASVAASALTVAIKTYAGSDPTVTDPVKISVRNSTVSLGDYTTLLLTAATSIVISSTSTLAATNSTAFKLWLVAFNDAGTVRLGIINCLSGKNIYPLGQFPVASSTAEGGAGGADSAHVFYTGTAVSSKPYTILAYMSYESGLATAGTWNVAPTRIQMFSPGVPLPGNIVQVAENFDSAMATGTTAFPFDNTTPLITEGNQYMSQAITPTSAANMLHIDGAFNFTITTASSGSISLFRSTTAVYACGLNTAVALFCGLHPLSHKELAGSTSSSTFTVRAGNNAGNTLTFNGSGGTALYNGIISSRLSVYEIMT